MVSMALENLLQHHSYLQMRSRLSIDMNTDHYLTDKPHQCTFDHSKIETNVSAHVLNINPSGKWGKKINPKTKKVEDWFLYQEITLQSSTIGADDIKYKNNQEKTPCHHLIKIYQF